MPGSPRGRPYRADGARVEQRPRSLSVTGRSGISIPADYARAPIFCLSRTEFCRLTIMHTIFGMCRASSISRQSGRPTHARIKSLTQCPVVSFARTDRDCSPLLTAPKASDSAPMCARSDRGRQLWPSASTRGRMSAQASGIRSRGGRLRSELANINPVELIGAVAGSRISAVGTSERNQSRWS